VEKEIISQQQKKRREMTAKIGTGARVRRFERLAMRINKATGRTQPETEVKALQDEGKLPGEGIRPRTENR